MTLVALRNLLKRILPPMQIHIWGGLGSQLFALLALDEVQNRFPSRKFRVVFHSGGVTERKPDLLELIPQGVEISFVSDFIESSEGYTHQQTKNPNSSLAKVFVRDLITKFKLVTSWDNSSSEPTFWTIQIRGHYRMIRVSSDSLNRVFDRIFDSKFSTETENCLSVNSIHFRIGDLVGLKGIIDPEILVNVAETIQYENNLKFRILSDSEDIASHYLSKIETVSSNKSLGTWETIEIGYKSEIFLGTLSKISYWIVILRVLGRPEMLSYLPKSSAEEILTFFRHYRIQAKIEPYDYALIESPETSLE